MLSDIPARRFQVCSGQQADHPQVVCANPLSSSFPSFAIPFVHAFLARTAYTIIVKNHFRVFDKFYTKVPNNLIILHALPSTVDQEKLRGKHSPSIIITCNTVILWLYALL